VTRYARSISLLKDAVRHTNRAYIFDNSGHDQERVWLAEVTDGHLIEVKVDRLPAWFSEALPGDAM
jgi:predicted ABC-type ATPase